MTLEEDALLQTWQANRDLNPEERMAFIDRVGFDPFFGESVMSSEGYEPFDIGHMTKGVWDNIVDLSNTWAIYPERRKEYRAREIQDLLDAQSLLNELLNEITKREAA